MKTERESFEKWFIKTKAYKLISEMNYFKMELFYFVEGRGEYRHSSVQIAFMAWQASAKREGFVLVPVCRFCSGHGEVGCRFEGTHPCPECNGSRIDPRLSVEATK